MRSTIRKIGVLGGRGMLGSNLASYFQGAYDVLAIDRENYDECKSAHFDLLINANGNSRRFFANEHPEQDFEMSTLSVIKSFFDFTADFYIYISSSDVYEKHTLEDAIEPKEIDYKKLCPYGFHKFLSEQIVRRYAPKYLILRASMMLGENLKKGPVFDALNGLPLFITRDSRIQVITTEEVARIIESLLEKNFENDVFNMGGLGTVSFEKAEELFGKPVAVSPEAARQEYEMDTAKLAAHCNLKTSQEYLEEFLESHQLK
jgi:dTDP-4-dehydrorhamnose reductase